MLKILKYLSFFISGTFFVFVVFFIFSRGMFLVMPGLFDSFVNFTADNLYYFSDFMIVLSSVAIVYSAIWARQSFWLTNRKDKTDRTIAYLELYNERKLFYSLRFVRDKLFKDKDFKTYERVCKEKNLSPAAQRAMLNRCREKYYCHVLEVLNYLDNFGLLVQHNKVDFDLFYNYFAVIIPQAIPNFEKYIRIFYPDKRSRRNVIFLLNEFKRYDSHKKLSPRT